MEGSLKERIFKLLQEAEMSDIAMHKALHDVPSADIWAALHELEREGRIRPRELFGRDGIGA